MDFFDEIFIIKFDSTKSDGQILSKKFDIIINVDERYSENKC